MIKDMQKSVANMAERNAHDIDPLDLMGLTWYDRPALQIMDQ
jgi:hypothetical protein